MRRRLGALLMCLGTALLVMALSLFLCNSVQARAAERSADEGLARLTEQIAAQPRKEVPSSGGTQPPEGGGEMAAVELGGCLYIGYLSLPDLGLELPIQSDWSYPKLKTAPCRYAGQIATNDLVLMAHNYESHFGRLEDLSPGDRVAFTDVEGSTTWYEAVAIELLPPSAVEEMTAGEYDLTLFTCTYGGKNRVTVRCDRLAGE